MKKSSAGKGLLALCVTGLLGAAGCGPAPEAAEPEGSTEQVQQGINGYYVSFDPNFPSDLLWRNQATGNNFAWLMNGPAVVGNVALPAIPSTFSIQATADFNPAALPAQPDLVIQGAAPGSEFVLFLSGFTISGSAALAPRAAADWYFAASGDFNNDTRSDLVLHNRVTGQWQYRYMNGAAIVAVSPVFTRPLPWFIVGAADFNLDGRTDLLWRNRNTGQNEIWVMNNTAVVSIVPLPVQSLAFYVGATADYTLDRNPDIVWHNPATGQVLLWRLTGTSLAGTQTIGVLGSGCPAWFSQATPPPATATTCNYLVGPR
jgi:hypothetical protein